MSASSAVSSVAVGAMRGFAMLHYVVAELSLEGQAVRSAQPEFSADTRRAGEQLVEEFRL